MNSYKMNNLFVLDGSGYVFRAYYGLPPLHDEDGHNVNAIFGFFRMLCKLLGEKPSGFVIAWDSPVKTLRKEQFEDYKANRVKMPDEFTRQMGMIKQLVEELSLPFLEAPGYEADDIIATIAQGLEQLQSDEVHIISADKDLKQLLRPGVVIMDPLKNYEYTEQTFLEEFGFAPLHMLDYLSLIGDSSDNIPGVRGIGPKSAQKLIKTWKNLDILYEHIDQISGTTKQKLLDGKASAYQSRELIRLMHVPDVQIDTHSRKCSIDFDHMKQTLVETYKFRSLEKVLDELKKQWQAGDQLSLFG